MLRSDDIDLKWKELAPEYIADGVKEIAAYPTVSVAWAGYIGLAVACWWNRDWIKLKDQPYSVLLGPNGFDDMDDHIMKDILGLLPDGKQAQQTRDFMIFARLESLIAGVGIDDAMHRAKIYLEEGGADGIMIHSKEKSGSDIKEFCLRFRQKHAAVPIVVVPTTYNHIKEEELHEWGVNIVIYANHMLRAAYPAMLKCAETILENERSLEANPICMPIKEILELIPGTK